MCDNIESFQVKYEKKCSRFLEHMLLMQLCSSVSDSYFEELVETYFVPEDFYGIRYFDGMTEQRMKLLLYLKNRDDLYIGNQFNGMGNKYHELYLRQLVEEGTYKSLAVTLQDLLESAIYNANPTLIKKLLHFGKMYNLSCGLDIVGNERHKQLYEWNVENVRKGNEKKPVGWRCGPCNALWPSSLHKDYLDCIQIMQKENWVSDPALSSKSEEASTSHLPSSARLFTGRCVTNYKKF